MSEAGMPSISNLLLAVAIAYLLGALPLAEKLSRRRGIDIFDVGTGLAGATNVLRNVGKMPATLVILGDLAKGILTGFISQYFLGIDGPWIVVPATAAVVGHWNSIFSRFRGGDGLVVLGGLTLAIFPEEFGIIGVAVACLVALAGQKMPYSSLFNILAGYTVIVFWALRYSNEYADTALAMGALAVIVFAHAVLGHARRRRASQIVGLAGSQNSDRA